MKTTWDFEERLMCKTSVSYIQGVSSGLSVPESFQIKEGYVLTETLLQFIKTSNVAQEILF